LPGSLLEEKFPPKEFVNKEAIRLALQESAGTDEPLRPSLNLSPSDLRQFASYPDPSQPSQFGIRLAYGTFVSFQIIFVISLLFRTADHYPIITEQSGLSAASLAILFLAGRNVSVQSAIGKVLVGILLFHETLSVAFLTGRILKPRGWWDTAYEGDRDISLVLLFVNVFCILCGAGVLRRTGIQRVIPI
jgi:hypothetical protein